MIDVKIEKGHQLPLGRTKTTYGEWKLFNEKTSQMEVGDSFFVSTINKDRDRIRSLYFVHLYRMMKNYKVQWKFTSKSVEGGLRFFRVS